MLTPEVLRHYQDELARLTASRSEAPPLRPLAVTIWQAMSVLQKAVRRGRVELALQAAATLLLDAPDRLWRRLGCIAFEDIGVADVDVAGMVTAALAGKRVRVGLGGEWAVASAVIAAMAAAPKCRAADDLVMVVQRHPGLARARRVQSELSIPELRRIVLGPASVEERGLALWFILGTDRQSSPHLPARPGEPAFVFDILDELGTPMTMVEIAREGFRRTRTTLCPFVGLLMENGPPAADATYDDDLPPETMLGELPAWSLDMFTREGRRALGQFAAGASDTALWLREHVPRDERLGLLSDLVFFAEGGLLRSRFRWPVGDRMRRLAEIESHGAHCPDATDVLALVRRDLPLLDEERARAA